MALRKFKQFVHDCETRRLKSTVLGEEADGSDIVDAATVIIGSELSIGERSSLSDAFIDSITRMEDRGGTIMAIAVELK
jgi:hypothetical protein